jgi:hypothetical protein
MTTPKNLKEHTMAAPWMLLRQGQALFCATLCPLLLLALCTVALWAQSPPGSSPYPATSDSSIWLRGEKVFGLPSSALPSVIVTTNGVRSASVPWAGPTNTLDLGSWRQYYASPTACSVTGFLNKDGTNVQSFVLEIKNTSATNWTFLYPAGVGDLNYASSYTVTNGTVLIWSGEYDPFLNRTNALARIAP